MIYTCKEIKKERESGRTEYQNELKKMVIGEGMMIKGQNRKKAKENEKNAKGSNK